jgi:hypothetical protein
MILKGHVDVSKVLMGRCSDKMQLLRLVAGAGERESCDMENSASGRNSLQHLEAWGSTCSAKREKLVVVQKSTAFEGYFNFAIGCGCVQGTATS